MIFILRHTIINLYLQISDCDCFFSPYLTEKNELTYKDTDEYLTIFLRPTHFYAESAYNLVSKPTFKLLYYYKIICHPYANAPPWRRWFDKFVYVYRFSPLTHLNVPRKFINTDHRCAAFNRSILRFYWHFVFPPYDSIRRVGSYEILLQTISIKSLVNTATDHIFLARAI